MSGRSPRTLIALRALFFFLLGGILAAGVYLFSGTDSNSPSQPRPTATATASPSKPPTTSRPPTSAPPSPSPTTTKPAPSTPPASPSASSATVKKSATTPAAPKTHREPTTTSRYQTRPTTGSPRAYARSVLNASQFSCLDSLAARESGWNVHATNPSSGAYGIGQALPGSKMASAGADWRTNGVTQVKWMISYVNGRYGSACAAWSFWRAHSWY